MADSPDALDKGTFSKKAAGKGTFTFEKFGKSQSQHTLKLKKSPGKSNFLPKITANTPHVVEELIESSAFSNDLDNQHQVENDQISMNESPPKLTSEQAGLFDSMLFINNSNIENQTVAENMNKSHAEEISKRKNSEE